MSTRFFTNHGAQTLFAKFEGVFSSNKDLAAFDALVGYLRSSGWFAVRSMLENVPEIRILFGSTDAGKSCTLSAKPISKLSTSGIWRIWKMAEPTSDLSHPRHEPRDHAL